MTTPPEYRPFVKAHGLGNDFVIFDAREEPLSLTPDQIRLIGDRRRGVGFDQMVVLEKSDTADCLMLFYNSDGTTAGACGNATRCVADMMMRETGRSETRVSTRERPVEGWRSEHGVTVNMGRPLRGWQEIPLQSEQDTNAVDFELGPLANPVAVNMGNPHAVFFVEDAETIDLETLGPKVEYHPMFPNRVNCSVVSLLGDNHLRLRVWERGAGITLACGTAACATIVAAHTRGLTGRSAQMDLNGGSLFMTWQDDDTILMEGPVSYSFKGAFPL